MRIETTFFDLTKSLTILAIFAIIQRNRLENHFFSDCLQKNVDKKRQFAYNKINCEHFGDFSQKMFDIYLRFRV